MTVLIDTNILVASFDQSDVNFRRALQILQSLANEKMLIVSPVLTEVFHLLAKHRHYALGVQSLRMLSKGFEIIELESSDIVRMVAIMDKYKHARFDYTDAAIMVVSERLNITRIATFDRRDFEIFRPTHVSAYELLPTL